MAVNNIQHVDCRSLSQSPC